MGCCAPLFPKAWKHGFTARNPARGPGRAFVAWFFRWIAPSVARALVVARIARARNSRYHDEVLQHVLRVAGGVV